MSKKYTYKQVNDIFKDRGYILLSKEYINNHIKLEYSCPVGHINSTTLKDFKNKNSECPICSKEYQTSKRRFNIEFVKDYFEKNSCTLLEEDYINIDTKMKYKCSCGNISYISFYSFKKGQRCKECGYKNRIYPESWYLKMKSRSINKLVNKLEKQKLIDKPKKQTIPIKPKKQIISSKPKKQTMIGKPKIKVSTHHSTSHTYSFVKATVEKEGYKLLDITYRGLKYPLGALCNKGHKIKIRFSDFKRGIRCRQCYLDKNIGENHPSWKLDKTQEERELRRRTNKYKKWRITALIRDNYTCQLTGKIGKLVVHHLDSYATHKDKRYNLDNGITLLKEVHNKFHNIYGILNNTKEQFDEFKSIEETKILSSRIRQYNLLHTFTEVTLRRVI